jgi:dihydrofolate synthase/folylpolyglutamate synthase
MKMTYEEAREFIQEAAKSGSVLGLVSIRRLMEELGNIQDTLPVIHIAGTNGKGSVGAYLAAVFQRAGLHVGRYCSPAVFDPLEVWQYDGNYITKEEYANVMSQVKSACDIMLSKGFECPTVFEIETAAAFVWFSEKKPDVVLLEVGMGGATDATNVISRPIASVITTISMDHMQFLGDTVAKIAAVKAGIIKEGCPVFSAPQEDAVTEVLQSVAREKHTKLVLLDAGACRLLEQKPGLLRMEYRSEAYGTLLLETKLAGIYQLRNAALAAETALALLPGLVTEVGKPDVNGECSRVVQAWNHGGSSAEERIDAQAKVSDNVNGVPKYEWLRTTVQQGIADAAWPGRFEVIGRNPLFIIDGAHNEDAAKCLERTLQNCFTNTKLTYIIGVLADKEHEKMLRILLPHADAVYTVTPDNPRALRAEALRDEAEKLHGNVTCCGLIRDAVSQALFHAKEAGTPILAFGSLSYLRDLKTAYNELM